MPVALLGTVLPRKTPPQRVWAPLVLAPGGGTDNSTLCHLPTEVAGAGTAPLLVVAELDANGLAEVGPWVAGLVVEGSGLLTAPSSEVAGAVPVLVGVRRARDYLRGGEWGLLDEAAGLLLVDLDQVTWDCYRGRLQAQ